MVYDLDISWSVSPHPLKKAICATYSSQSLMFTVVMAPKSQHEEPNFLGHGPFPLEQDSYKGLPGNLSVFRKQVKVDLYNTAAF